MAGGRVNGSGRATRGSHGPRPVNTPPDEATKADSPKAARLSKIVFLWLSELIPYGRTRTGDQVAQVVVRVIGEREQRLV